MVKYERFFYVIYESSAACTKYNAVILEYSVQAQLLCLMVKYEMFFGAI